MVLNCTSDDYNRYICLQKTKFYHYTRLCNLFYQVVQLEEILEVRHSVFIVGNAGTGKTQVWKTLFKTYQNMKRKPIYNDLNPKAVTNDELFGVINPATREWKDGTTTKFCYVKIILIIILVYIVLFIYFFVYTT